MSLIQGTIREVYMEDGIAKATVFASGTIMRVPLTLMMEAKVGDEILVDAGVAIGHAHHSLDNGRRYVFGSAGESPEY
jgi:hypothetical protein